MKLPKLNSIYRCGSLYSRSGTPLLQILFVYLLIMLHIVHVMLLICMELYRNLQ